MDDSPPGDPAPAGLVRSWLPTRFPTRISVSPGAPAPRSAGRARRVVTLPRPLRGHGFRMRRARGRVRASGRGIAEVRGPGFPMRARRSGPMLGTVGSRRRSSPAGPRAAPGRHGGGAGRRRAVDGDRLRRPVALPARRPRHRRRGPVRPLLMSLRSPAPPRWRPPRPSHRSVIDSGDQGNGSYTGVRVRVTQPSWLVLGESYNPGWHATCDGRRSGPPR